MDFSWLVPLVTALGAAIGGILVGVAQLRKHTIPQSELMMVLRSLWDWIVYTGQEMAIPRHIREAAWEQLRRGPDDDSGAVPTELGSASAGRRTRDRFVDHGDDVRDPDG